MTHSRGTDHPMHRRSVFAIATTIIIVIAIVYWPALHGQFVWDDVHDFVEMPWLTHGDYWKHYIFKDFNDWTTYFRPLVVGLFTIQVRLFHDTPGPMHAVSLALHLANTILVGLLCWHFSTTRRDSLKRSTVLVASSMLVYGLHPALIESVAWIGCQFDLVATMFMVGGLLANLRIRHALTRATVIATLFFLAACAKESAASFPLMLIVLNWALLPREEHEGIGSRLHRLILQNWKTYLAILLAGSIYLAFRFWALGELVHPTNVQSFAPLARLQEVSFIYLHYWKMLIWPMIGIDPLHEFDDQKFHAISASSLLIDITAISIIGTSAYLAIKRVSPIGCMAVMVTVALLPVLHLAPVTFVQGLYHERYVMPALAAVCAMLPLVRFHIPVQKTIIARSAIGIAASLWLILAVTDIRLTVPLWSNGVSLWRWALATNPNSLDAKSSLLGVYLQSGDYANANKLADKLMIDHVPCANCMLNVASLAIAENDPAKAAVALDQVKNSSETAADETLFRRYLRATGQMLVEQGQLEEAAGLFRAAMQQNPLDPQPQLSLAAVLAMQNKKTEAAAIGASAITLLPPDQRDQTQETLNRLLNGHQDGNDGRSK